MKNNIVLIIAVAFLSTAGIIRDDVSKEKHLELASQSQFDCVGQLYKEIDSQEVRLGSCVLISDRFVLTAVHMLIESETKDSTYEFKGRKVTVFIPVNEYLDTISAYSCVFKGEKYPVDRLSAHPRFLKDKTHDIAVLRLVKPVDDIKIPKLNRKYDELDSRVVGVGYGAFGFGGKPGSVVPSDEKQAGENSIDSIGDYLFEGKILPSLMFADFDHPQNKLLNKIGSAEALPLEYMPTGGDSGSGLFRQKGDEWELIGVSPAGGIAMESFFKNGYYGNIMSWIRISVAIDWIQKTMAQND